MKNKILIHLILVAFCTMLSITVSAEKDDEIVLKNGKVLRNPYIISRTPAGLNVGHENGVIFVRFNEMSKKRQKQYGYDPKKSKIYKKKIAKAQRNRQLRLAKKDKNNKNDYNDSGIYIPDRFAEKPVASVLQDELSSLIKEKARLERERSLVSSGKIAPRSGKSDDIYVSYRGGKVYRKKQMNYAKQTTKNVNTKRRRLKEITAALQKNVRRTITVRNLISRQKSGKLKKGRTMNY